MRKKYVLAMAAFAFSFTLMSPDVGYSVYCNSTGSGGAMKCKKYVLCKTRKTEADCENGAYNPRCMWADNKCKKSPRQPVSK